MFSVPSRSPFFLAGALASAALSADSAPSAQQTVAGTYHVAICKKQPCAPDDTANVLVSGVFVLSDTAYTLAAFPDSVRFSRQAYDMNGRRNGCSATALRRPAPSTYAAIGGMELINWSPMGSNGIGFAMHRLGEIEYQVQLTFRGERVSGIGRSGGESTAVPAYPDDVIVAHKAGPPDHQICADSAMAWLRKARGR
jgi:hypothetical protein